MQSFKKKRAIIRRDGMICGICRETIEDRSDLTIDHIIPKSKGGSNSIKNLRLAHRYCNGKRGCRSRHEGLKSRCVINKNINGYIVECSCGDIVFFCPHIEKCENFILTENQYISQILKLDLSEHILKIKSLKADITIEESSVI